MMMLIERMVLVKSLIKIMIIFVLHLICAIRSEFPWLEMVLNTISIQGNQLFNREYFSHQLFCCWLYMSLLVFIVQGQEVVWKSNLEGEVWKSEGWQAKDPKMHCLAKNSTIMMKLTIKVWWSQVRDEIPDKWSKKCQKIYLMSMWGKTHLTDNDDDVMTPWRRESVCPRWTRSHRSQHLSNSTSLRPICGT